MEWVLDSGPWHIGGKPLILRRWQPGMNLLKPLLQKIPIWVKLFNVPLEYWNIDGFSYVASAIGVPLYLDALMESCSRLSFARVCIEVDVESTFPTNFSLVTSKGLVINIQAEYPWKPQVCPNCHVFGHTAVQCANQLKKV